MTDTKQVTLGGVTYDIPQLAIKQNRHVEVLINRHREYFISVYKTGGKTNPLDLTEEEALDFTHVVYHALTRALPNLTLAHFEALPITMNEILRALPICVEQSGLYRQAPAAESATPAGEAQVSPTGTPS